MWTSYYGVGSCTECERKCNFSGYFAAFLLWSLADTRNKLFSARSLFVGVLASLEQLRFQLHCYLALNSVRPSDVIMSLELIDSLNDERPTGERAFVQEKR
jgi:hypothetical protein